MNFLRTNCLMMARILAAILTFTEPQDIAAKSIYVAPGGSDGNAGSLGRPFQSITKALSTLQAGDTLFLRGGTYNQAIDSHATMIPSGTSFEKPVIIQSYNGERVSIQPGSGDAVLSIEGDVHHTIWKDLIFDAAQVQFGLYLSNGAHHNRFHNIEVKNAKLSGILTSEGMGGTAFNEFIHCKSHNNGSSVLDHGIDLRTSDNLVEGGEYYNNAGFGIHLYNELPTVNRNIIRGAHACNNGMYGIIITSGDGNLAHDNVICGNAHGGIEINWGTGSTNTKVYNNTIYNNLGESIAIGSNNKNVEIRNNRIFMNSGGIVDYGAIKDEK